MGTFSQFTNPSVISAERKSSASPPREKFNIGSLIALASPLLIGMVIGKSSPKSIRQAIEALPDSENLLCDGKAVVRFLSKPFEIKYQRFKKELNELVEKIENATSLNSEGITQLQKECEQLEKGLKDFRNSQYNYLQELVIIEIFGRTLTDRLNRGLGNIAKADLDNLIPKLVDTLLKERKEARRPLYEKLNLLIIRALYPNYSLELATANISNSIRGITVSLRYDSKLDLDKINNELPGLKETSRKVLFDHLANLRSLAKDFRNKWNQIKS